MLYEENEVLFCNTYFPQSRLTGCDLVILLVVLE